MPTSLPGRQTVRNHRCETHLAGVGERGETWHVRGLEGRAIVELGERLVGTPVGNEHEVLHIVNGR